MLHSHSSEFGYDDDDERNMYEQAIYLISKRTLQNSFVLSFSALTNVCFGRKKKR